MSKLELLRRPTAALHVFSDTITPGDDFDARLTSRYRHLRFGDSESGIGDSLELGAYGVELISQLVDGAKVEVEGVLDPHPDISEAQKILNEKAIIVLANSAQRDSKTPNGSHFYLALLENGVEVVATPLSLLSYVRDKIKALYEIPNRNHPFFDGDREQFRSSVVGRTRQRPDHLVEVNPVIVPEASDLTQLVYVDRFGNTRLKTGTRALEELDKARNDDGVVGVKVNGNDPVGAHFTSCLSAVPGGQFGLYGNVADGNEANYLELVLRWPDGERPSGHQALGQPHLGSDVRFVRI